MTEKRKLGNSGLEVTPFALGGNVFGWTADEATSFKLLDRFVDTGFNFIDTADSYSKWAPGNRGGESESIIGKWLKRSGRRDQVVIATKVGSELGPGQKGLSKAYIMSAVERSLARLQTDYIDLYQSHFDDPETPFPETLETYEELKQQGKIRAAGASNLNAGRLSEALAAADALGIAGYRSMQLQYNLYDRAEYEKELEPVCRANGLGVMTYFSLASGFLAGKYRSAEDAAKSARARFLEKYLNPRGFKIEEALQQAARELQSAPATVALAWVMGRPGITAAIASATRTEQLDELSAAATLQLEPSAIALLDAASAYE